MLARAPRSAAEVEAHLDQRGFSVAAIAATLQALRHLRYIDDQALACRRAEELLLRRGFGRLRVASELTHRGLADSVVTRAIAAVVESRSDLDLARQALRQRFRDKPLSSNADRARAFRFLVGRGHPAEVVNEILEDST